MFHMETGKLNLLKIDRRARILTDLSNAGMDVILVSSGAQATAKSTLGISYGKDDIPLRQACASIG